MNNDKEDFSLHYLQIGEVFASLEPYKITTVLGSCVAVCLWDPVTGGGGINHYMMPLWNGEGLPSPRYGNVAVKKLIERMQRQGSLIRNLKAKVFGGASTIQGMQGTFNIAERNIAIAREHLAEAGISIISSDVGGNTGRKLTFNTLTGVVLVKKLKMRAELATRKQMPGGGGGFGNSR